jgi:hypothetical protein
MVENRNVKFYNEVSYYISAEFILAYILSLMAFDFTRWDADDMKAAGQARWMERYYRAIQEMED